MSKKPVIPSLSNLNSHAAYSARAVRQHFQQVRDYSLHLCDGLSEADMQLQSMPDASPLKWHLGHTTWFFETCILAAWIPAYQAVDPRYNVIFNSYYHAIGKPFERASRGLLSRPSLAEINHYRATVDAGINDLLRWTDDANCLELMMLGINHEQQHQELMLTDIKHALAQNPLQAVYRQVGSAASNAAPDTLHPRAPPAAQDNHCADDWLEVPEGVIWIGARDEGFSYDNERLRHRRWQSGYRIARRLVTNRQFLAFMQAGGYQNPLLWLADGWTWVTTSFIQAPLYWVQQDGEWQVYTLRGVESLNLDDPVCHLGFFEADAFACWSGKRLPTEFEWEIASDLDLQRAADPDLQSTAGGEPDAAQWFGAVWQWTSSAYSAYPGFQVAEGLTGEYNGKFMCNQFVLRGSSCVTPREHSRTAYRNFLYPHQRWQFSGLRLCANDP